MGERPGVWRIRRRYWESGLRRLFLLSTGTAAAIAWVALPELSERVREPLLVWAAITVTVVLLDKRRPHRARAEPAYHAGFIAGFDAASKNGGPGRARASQPGRNT